MSAKRRCSGCGAYYDFEFGVTTICKYCGTKNLISFSQDTLDKIKQANSLRFVGEFEKAINIYNELIEKYPKSSEIHFGRFLAIYSVTDIDNLTAEKVLTISPVSVYEDEDYIKAMEFDLYKKSQYQKAAEFVEERRLINVKFNNCISKNGYSAMVVSANQNQDRNYADTLFDAISGCFDVFYSEVSTEDFMEEDRLVVSKFASDKVRALYVVVDGDYSVDESVLSLVDRFLKTHKKNFLTIVTNEPDRCYKLTEKTDNVIAIDGETVSKIIEDLKVTVCTSLADFREFREKGKKVKDPSNPSPVISI